MSKKPLPADKKDECLRLKAIFNSKKSELGLTQEKLAHALEMNQSSVSHYLNGVNPLNPTVAASFARILKVDVSAFSDRLAQEMAKIADAVGPITAKESNVIAADFSRGRAREGEIEIPQYDVSGSMGPGQVPAEYFETIRHIVLHESYLRSHGVSYTQASNLAVITGFGQSMEGTFNDGDPIIVDRGVLEFTGDGIYVFTWDGMLYIKRLQKESWETFDMISDNPKHKDRIVKISEVDIHARVLLAWNATKL